MAMASPRRGAGGEDAAARALALVEASNARVFDALEDRLYASEAKLEEVGASKTEMGVAMYGLQQEVNRLSARLRAVVEDNARLVKEREALQSQVVSGERSGARLEATIAVQKKELTKAAGDAVAAAEHIDLLREASRTLKAGLKAHQVSEGAAAREAELVAAQLKSEREERDKLSLRVERVEAERERTQQQLLLQEHETKVAQRQVEKVVEEMQALSASRTVMQKQWQAALVAMSQRDKVLEAAERRRAELVTELAQERARAGGERALNALEMRAAQLAEARAAAEERAARLEVQLKLAGDAAAAHKAAAERADAQVRELVATDKEQQLSVFRAETSQAVDARLLHELKAELAKARVETAEAQARARRAEAEGERAAAALRAELEAGGCEAISAAAARDNVISRLQLEAADSEAQAAVKGRREMQETVTRQEMMVQRQGSEIDRLKATLDQRRRQQAGAGHAAGAAGGPEVGDEEGGKPRAESDRVRELEQRIRDRDKIIKGQLAELQTLRQQWARTEGQLVLVSHKAAAMAPQAAAAGERAAHATRLHELSRAFAAKADKAKLAADTRADAVHAQQRLQHVAAHKVRAENVELSGRAEEADLRARAGHLELELEVSQLRASLNDAARANHDVARRQLESESRLVLAQGRGELMERRLAEAAGRAEQAELETGALRRQLHELQRETSSLRKESGQRKLREAAAGARVAAQRAAPSERPADSARDLELGLAKAQTVAADRETRCAALEVAVDKERARSERLGQAFLERDRQAKDLAEALEATKAQLAQLSSRAALATDIAAALEGQLHKAARGGGPAHYISYEPQVDLKPSPELQAALAGEGATQRRPAPHAHVSSLQPRPPALANTAHKADAFVRPATAVAAAYVNAHAQHAQHAQ